MHGAKPFPIFSCMDHQLLNYQYYSMLRIQNFSFLSHFSRVIKQFELEGTVKGHPAEPSCSKQGGLQLDQVVFIKEFLKNNIKRSAT